MDIRRIGAIKDGADVVGKNGQKWTEATTLPPFDPGVG